MGDCHFVGHLDLVHPSRIALGYLRKALFVKLPHSVVIVLGQPIGDYLIVKQTVELRKYSFLLAILHTKIGRRSAIYVLRAVRIVTELSLLGLRARPEERNGCKIEIFRKGITVTGVYLLILVLVKHKEICPVLKIVSFLIYMNTCANYWLSVFIKNAKGVVGLTVFFYISSCTLVQLV